MRAIVIIGLLALALPAVAYYWEEPGEMNEYQLRLDGITGYDGYPPGVPDDPPVDHTYDVLHYDLYLDIDTVNDVKVTNERDPANPAKLSETKVNDVLIKGTPPYSFFDGSALPSGAYEYRLEAEYSGSGRDMGTCRNAPVNPSVFALYQSYPNPARGEVVFSFALPTTANATLELYDIRGRKIATILDEEKAPGVHEVRYDGEMADGVYLYKLTADSETAIGKMIVSR